MAAALLFVYSSRVETNIAAAVQSMNKTQSVVDQLRQERRIDQTTKDFLTFSEEINLLRNGRRDWVAVFRTIDSEMPPGGSIEEINANDIYNVSVNYQFSSLTDIADYLAALLRSPLIAGVEVKSINRLEQQLPETPARMPQDRNSAEATDTGNSSSNSAFFKATLSLKLNEPMQVR